MSNSKPADRPAFRTTRWTLIDALQSDDEDARRAALAELTEVYWGPMYHFARRLGRNPDEAAELTQAFFQTVILHRRLFESANRDRARLRTLLRTALRRFAIDEVRTAPKITAAAVPIEWLETEERRLQSSDAGPEDSFDRRWAIGILEEALRRTEQHFREQGREAHWTAFDRRVLRPCVDGTEPVPLAQLADELERTQAQLANEVHYVKKRLLAVLREVVLQTVDEPEDAEDELQHLQSLMR